MKASARHCSSRRRAARCASTSVENQKLDQALERVNKTLTLAPDGAVSMTLLLMRVSPDAGRIEWCSAGHDPAILYDVEKDEFVELDGIQLPLGRVEDVDYRLQSRDEFKSGQLIVAASDGVWTTRNDAGEEFGKQRLRELIRQNALRPAIQIGRELESALTTFRGSEPMRDDATYVVVRRV
ncbi:MAG: PP2C family protein-serine/threonine phosphatase [Tepidisphaeraceae bacterium]